MSNELVPFLYQLFVDMEPTPWHQVGIDLLGPFPRSKSGNTTIVVVMDHFTRFPEAVAIPDKKAETMANAFA